MTSSLCKCGNPRRTGQNNFLKCHAEIVRSYRERASSTLDKMVKSNAISYLHVYVNRGKVTKGACFVCGTIKDVHGHHENYDEPLSVLWLCKTHHIELHRSRTKT